MALDFGGSQMFGHSFDFEQGMGKVRGGMGTFIVAQDGSGDFSDIQDALNSLSSSGGSIFIKEGTYNLQTYLSIKYDNTLIQGTGKGTKIVMDANNTAIWANGKDNILIRDLYLLGDNNEASTSNIAIQIGTTSDNITIENCYIENFNYGILNQGTNCFINGNFITGSKYMGIRYQTGDYGIIKGNICKDGGTNSYGISLTESDKTIIMGNVCTGNTTCGIIIGISDNCVISNNICTGNSTGILIEENGAAYECDGTIIIGNQCLGNSSAAITDNGVGTLPNGATGTTNLALDDLNIIA